MFLTDLCLHVGHPLIFVLQALSVAEVSYVLTKLSAQLPQHHFDIHFFNLQFFFFPLLFNILQRALVNGQVRVVTRVLS